MSQRWKVTTLVRKATAVCRIVECKEMEWCIRKFVSQVHGVQCISEKSSSFQCTVVPFQFSLVHCSFISVEFLSIQWSVWVQCHCQRASRPNSRSGYDSFLFGAKPIFMFQPLTHSLTQLAQRNKQTNNSEENFQELWWYTSRRADMIRCSLKQNQYLCNSLFQEKWFDMIGKKTIFM